MPDVHKTMDDLNDQRMLAAEITDAITASMQDSISADIDEEELEKELQQLQEDELDSLTRGLRDVEAPIGDLQVGRGVQGALRVGVSWAGAMGLMVSVQMNWRLKRRGSGEKLSSCSVNSLRCKVATWSIKTSGSLPDGGDASVRYE